MNYLVTTFTLNKCQSRHALVTTKLDQNVTKRKYENYKCQHMAIIVKNNNSKKSNDQSFGRSIFHVLPVPSWTTEGVSNQPIGTKSTSLLNA